MASATHLSEDERYRWLNDSLERGRRGGALTGRRADRVGHRVGRAGVGAGLRLTGKGCGEAPAGRIVLGCGTGSSSSVALCRGANSGASRPHSLRRGGPSGQLREHPVGLLHGERGLHRRLRRGYDAAVVPDGRQ